MQKKDTIMLLRFWFVSFIFNKTINALKDMGKYRRNCYGKDKRKGYPSK